MSIISVRDVGVHFTIQRQGANTMRDRLLQFLRGKGESEEFWALRHVNFDLHEHEVVGLLGSNGAGKSTLCRVLSQLLWPDEGSVEVNGRVAPLLGISSGWRRDLTGRENLRLGAALIGLCPRRALELIPEMIEFAELNEFIDNLVGTYSSGMKARLGFALATAIDPDILIVDESLGVGDSYFTKKCEQRMRELMGRSRAIVLVSHSATTIRNMCTRAVWLDRGAVIRDGPASEVAPEYEAWQAARLLQRKALKKKKAALAS